MKLKKINFSLVFNRRNRLNKDGTSLIQIRAYQNNPSGTKERWFSTGIFLEPLDWDEKYHKVCSTHPLAHLYNQHLRKYLQNFEDFELNLLQRKGRCTIHDLPEKVPGGIERDTYNFLEFYERELDLDNLMETTRKNQRTTLNKLLLFKGKYIHFDDLNYKFIRDFERFLYKKGLVANGIEKHHKNLKKYINRAVLEGFIEDNPYKKFKVKREAPHRTYLTEEELGKLENLLFTENQKFLEKIRDFFLLCCYTGLRFSDASKLNENHIVKSSNGWEIQMKSSKTKKLAVLPISLIFIDKNGQSKPVQLLKKYWDNPEYRTNDGSFRDIPFFNYTNQYVNRELRTITKMAGVSKRITTHAGRRTFATIMATKVQAPIVQRLLQHQKMDMTNQYIQLGHGDIKKELKKIKWV